MSNATPLNSDNFDSTVGNGVTLVDFWAEWCAPCRMMTPTLDELAKEYDGKAAIASVNVDQAMDLAQRYGVNSIPTLIVFCNGEVKKRFVGVTSKQDLSAAIDAACD